MISMETSGESSGWIQPQFPGNAFRAVLECCTYALQHTRWYFNFDWDGHAVRRLRLFIDMVGTSL